MLSHLTVNIIEGWVPLLVTLAQTLQNSRIQKVADLTGQLITLQSKLEKVIFRLENIKKDDDLVNFYTGFPNYV